MSNNSQAALLASHSGEVIGLVYDAPEKSNTIVLAGAFTADGAPVNCRKMRISRSKKNLEKAQEMPEVINANDDSVYIFEENL